MWHLLQPAYIILLYFLLQGSASHTVRNCSPLIWSTISHFCAMSPRFHSYFLCLAVVFLNSLPIHHYNHKISIFIPIHYLLPIFLQLTNTSVHKNREEGGVSRAPRSGGTEGFLSHYSTFSVLCCGVWRSIVAATALQVLGEGDDRVR